MVNYICPICDRVMKSRHICTNCKTWVKNPWVREVGYYLNERHPQEDEGCSYHDQKYFGKDPGGSKIQVYRTQTATPNPITHSKSMQDIMGTNTAQEKEAEDSKPKRSVSPFGIVILIFIAINVVLPILIRVLRSLSDMLRYNF